jgi:hypothetical protein
MNEHKARANLRSDAPRGLKGLQYLAWCIGRDDAYLRNPPVRYRRYEMRYRAAYRKGYLAQQEANKPLDP